MRLLPMALVTMCAGCYSSALLAQPSPEQSQFSAAQINAMAQTAAQDFGLAPRERAVKNPPALPVAPPVPAAKAPKACAIPLLNAMPKKAGTFSMPKVIPSKSNDSRMPLVAGLPPCDAPAASAGVTLPGRK